MGRVAEVKLLLDTHVLIWMLLDPHRLTRRVSKVLQDSRNQLWISPISTWEIVVLSRKGRLKLKDGPEAWFSSALRQVPCREAPLTNDVALATDAVVLPHRDPADTFLAATARVYDLTLVTSDDNLLKGKGYSVLSNR